MKQFKIIFFNILFILVVFFIADFIFFSVYKNQHELNISYFQNMTKKIAVSDTLDKNYFSSQNLRPALNEKNTNYKSIIFTGCSFIYGIGLEEYQTISYKTSKLLKNPVYNLGFPSKAINTIYAAIELGVFDSVVKVKPKTIIYNYADFHLQRILMPNIFFENNEFLYTVKNKKLERKRPPFVVSRSPLLSIIRERIHNYLLYNNKYYKNYVQELLKIHFIEMKKLLHSKYGDFKFIIMIYEPSPIFEEMANDIKEEGFIIVRVKEDFNVDVYKEENRLPDGHPSEKAWSEIVPKLVKYL